MPSAGSPIAPELLAPPHLHTRAEVLTRPSPVPALPGIYAWYFDSTLRPTLGCLLGLELRRIASRKRPGTATRMTFGRDGERQLDAWMEQHARVVWLACADAWDLEHELLRRLSPPLNLDANVASAFRAELRALRDEARARARMLPPLEQQLALPARTTDEPVHAGRPYRDAIAPGVAKAGGRLEVPLEGLSLGEQLAVYSSSSRRSETSM